MIQTIIIYKENKKNIEDFLLENITNNITNDVIGKHLDKFFKIFKSLETLFVTDKEYQQFKAKLTKEKQDIEILPWD